MNYRILNLEPENYSPAALAVLQDIGTIDFGPLSRSQMIKVLPEYDVLITRLGHRIDAEVLAHASALKAIVTATTGLNHIDENAAERQNIKIICLRGEIDFLRTVYATAEHTMALILSLVRNLPAAHQDVLCGNWDRDAYKGRELQGMTLGVFGFGRLGSKVAEYAKSFGMNILAHDILDFTDTDMVKFVSCDVLLENSDIITMHIPYTPQTENLMGADKFSKMKAGSYFVNTSRGEIIDESALLEFLESGALAGAALDVMRGENSGIKNWLRRDPLKSYARKKRNLIITPHIGGATYESMEKTEIFVAKKLLDFMRSQNR